MADRCVYMVTVNGVDVPVEAANQAQAIRIATRPLVTGCRPLKGNEVLDLYRAGTPVLTANGKVGGEAEGEPEGFTIVPGVELKAGDVLVPLGPDGTYRVAESGDDMTGAITVPEGFEQEGDRLIWPLPLGGSPAAD